MTKPIPLTKAAMKRAIAAAQEQGAPIVEVLSDGTIRIMLRKDYELAASREPSQSDDQWSRVEA